MRVLVYRDLRTKKGIPFSRQHIARKINNGTFPKPFKLGEGDKALSTWLEIEIDRWIRQRAAERKAASSSP
jgi:prophage regulatory protein